VTAQVTNLGASSIIEPLNLAPGSVSSADAGPSTVNVYISNVPRITASSIVIGQLAVPMLSQNSTTTVSATLTLPAKQPTYPGIGHNAFILFAADATHAVNEIDETNNVAPAVMVKMTPNLPDLKTYALDVPPTIQPGDTIQPNIRIANVGSADTAAQGPVTVLLVASLDKNFGAGASVIGSYTIDNVPASARTPTQNFVVGDVNIDPPTYVRTISGVNATVPIKPGKYYIGVVVDPNNTIRELSEYGKPGSAHTVLTFPHIVKTVRGLPPAGVITAPITAIFPFPITATSQGSTPGVTSTAVVGTANASTLAALNSRKAVTAGGETGPTIGTRQAAVVLGNTRRRALPTNSNTGTSLTTIPRYIGEGSVVNTSDLVVTAAQNVLIDNPTITTPSAASRLSFATITQ
jgi:hypothetical protein